MVQNKHPKLQIVSTDENRSAPHGNPQLRVVETPKPLTQCVIVRLANHRAARLKNQVPFGFALVTSDKMGEIERVLKGPTGKSVLNRAVRISGEGRTIIILPDPDRQVIPLKNLLVKAHCFPLISRLPLEQFNKLVCEHLGTMTREIKLKVRASDA